MVELSITIKDENQSKSQTQKFLFTKEEILLSHNDLTLKRHVEECINAFKGSPDDIIIKTKMTW